MQMKNLRLPLFGLLGLAAVGLGAVILFGHKSETPTPDEASTPAPTDNTPAPTAEPTDVDLEGLSFDENKPAPAAPTAAVAKDANGKPVAPAAGTIPGKTDPAKPATTDTAKPAATKGAVVWYELKKNETLGKVASKFGCKLADIYKLNPGLNDQTATRMQIGHKFKVADNKGVGGTPVEGATVTAPGTPATTPGATASTPAASSAPATVSANEPQEGGPEHAAPEKAASEPVKAAAKPDVTIAKTHILKRGDNYFELSRSYYGAVSYWRVIRDANPNWDPFKFEEGTVIDIPALRQGGTDAAPTTVERNAASNVIPPLKK
jgi:LysM repeat protein